MRKYDRFWQSNVDWFKFENGEAVPTPNAPPEALESYKHYLEQHKEYEKKCNND